MRRGTARLPVAGFFQLADLALDQIAFQKAQMSDEEGPVEMVDLVAEGAGKQSFAAHLELSSGGVLRADGDVRGASYIASEAGNRKAALLFALLAFRVDDFGVRADDLRFGILAVANVDHCQTQADSNLRSSQAHSRGSVHRFEHVRDESFQLVIEFLDGLGGCLEYWIAELYDGMDHFAPRVADLRGQNP